MIQTVIFWLENSRWYALPMTIMCWLIAFMFGVVNDGNILYGLLALIGLLFAHLAANLFDDYIDFKKMSKNEINGRIILTNSQNGKCAFLLNNSASLKQTLFVVVLYCFIASIIGLVLTILTGIDVIWYALGGAFVVLLYPFLPRFGELLLAFAYGPLMFGGIYYVMTNEHSWEVIMLSIAPALFTVGLLYIHTILDYDFDLKENKYTLANSFSSKESALNFWVILIAIGYFFVFLCVIFDVLNWQAFLSYFTFVLVLDLYNSMLEYFNNKDSVPVIHWYNFPFEHQRELIESNRASFMFRLYQARNLMIYFSIFYVLSIIVD